MADMLADAADFVAEAQTEHLSQQVTYTKFGGGFQATVAATLGRSTVDLPDAGGGLVRVESWDFLIDADLLAIAGTQFEPVKGDLIELVIGTQTHRREVMPLGFNEDAWEWADRYHLKRRIHTKLVRIA
jgi:hypothetical protein